MTTLRIQGGSGLVNSCFAGLPWTCLVSHEGRHVRGDPQVFPVAGRAEHHLALHMYGSALVYVAQCNYP